MVFWPRPPPSWIRGPREHAAKRILPWVSHARRSDLACSAWPPCTSCPCRCRRLQSLWTGRFAAVARRSALHPFQRRTAHGSPAPSSWQLAPSPFRVPISITVRPAKRRAIAVCTTCGERVGGALTACTAVAQSTSVTSVMAIIEETILSRSMVLRARLRAALAI